MKLTPQLKAQIAKAVQTSMRIEGYTAPITEAQQPRTPPQSERVQMPPNGEAR